jgi:FtsZ-binding cell division protein ZapB
LSSSFDEELFEKIEVKNNICFNFAITTIKLLEFFNFDEIEEDVVSVVNFKVNVQDALQTMQPTPTLLKSWHHLWSSQS